MPLPVPVLDTKTFDDLATEAQALIPRTLPAWTDRNPSDPGITLLELFAFVVEAAFYQIDRVPDRTLRHFAELAGTVGAPDEPVGALLCRAVGALSATNRAVTPADSEFIARSGILAITPPLTRDLPAGTPVFPLQVQPGASTLTAPAAAGGATLAVTDSASLRPGDVLLLSDTGTQAGAGQADFTQVAAVGAPGDPAAVELSGPVSDSYPAGTSVTRLSQPAGPMVSRLVRPATAGADVLLVEPAASLTGSLLLGTGAAAVPVLATGVARAKVVTQLLSSDQVFPADLVTAVVIVPDGGGTPSHSLLQAIFTLMRDRSPITTRVRVAAPNYRPLRVDATVVRAFPALLRKDTVQQEAQAALQRFMSPLQGGEDGQGWEFGRAVYRSELSQVLQDTTGVDHVRELVLDGDPAAEALPLSQDPAQASVSLPQLIEATVTVVDG
ncbi:MAG TPA: baseplate J/gp47 family protein [Streptosporangiaceae bacterium]|nr:baseplate J/gp47 family protein [Streptosporangiaceae bacterium]